VEAHGLLQHGAVFFPEAQRLTAEANESQHLGYLFLLSKWEQCA
jgi:hypothetical protein